MRWESKKELRRLGALGREGGRRGKIDKKGHTLMSKI